MKLVVGSRGSKLALVQTKRVMERLEKEGYEVELKVIKTEGDIMKDKPLHEFKGRGAFVRAIDLALARKEVDVAVHSYKDVPSQRVEGTVVAAVLERDSPCDALVSNYRFEELPEKAKIGTSSLRRVKQFSRLRSDLVFENLRGNLDTRIRKLKDGIYDGIIVAEAGILRLNLNVKYQSFPPDLIVPAANQGVIAVATRKGEEELVSFMNDDETFLEANVERAVLKVLGIGCAIPAGIYAEVRGGKVKLICELFGERYLRIDENLCRESAVEEAVEIAKSLRREVWERST